MHNKLRRQLEAAINEPSSLYGHEELVDWSINTARLLMHKALEALGGPVAPMREISPVQSAHQNREHGLGAVESDTPYDHSHDVATAEGMPEPSL